MNARQLSRCYSLAERAVVRAYRRRCSAMLGTCDIRTLALIRPVTLAVCTATAENLYGRPLHNAGNEDFFRHLRRYAHARDMGKRA